MSGICSENRIKLSANAFEETKGAAALAVFLRSVAGVDRVEDVPEADRFRVNRELRNAANEAHAATPEHQRVFACIGRKAFAKMQVRK